MSSSIREFSPAEKLTMDEFKKYLQVVSELNAIASKIEEWLDKNVWSVIGGSKIRVARVPYDRWPEEIKRIVVSGLKAERYKSPYYVNNAYALFIKDFIGVELENPAMFVEKLSFGEDLSDINVVFTNTWFLVFVSEVRKKTDFILKRASELGVEIGSPKISGKPIHELIEGFVQKVHEIMVGVSEFATSVWGLRKITPSYMKKVYGEIPREILNVLGFKKLLEVKHVELWGFEDYFTQSAVYCIDSTPWLIVNGVPAPLGFWEKVERISDVTNRQRIVTEARKLYDNPLITLGGAICSLNQTAWSYTRRLRDILRKWFRDYIDLETEYMRITWGRLEAVGWTIPGYLSNSLAHNVTSDYIDFKEGFIYSENGIIERKVSYSYHCVCRYTESAKEIGLVARIIYDLAPATLLGVSDLTFKLRLHGKASPDHLCRDLTYYDVSSYEDVDAIVVFFRKA